VNDTDAPADRKAAEPGSGPLACVIAVRSERKGTALERCQLPPEKAVAILRHIREGCGVRATGRLVGVSKDTVLRYVALAGDQAKNLHDELVAFSP